VRVTVPVESTGGTVLAVPVSALTLAPDGSSRVQRAVEGTTEFVPVRPGLTADGFVAIQEASGVLKAGDMVVIGFDQRSTAVSQPSAPSDGSVAPGDTLPPLGGPTTASPGVAGG
jgi:multidrug efflux pump subunit AcrA (membrane-fusion protein)